MKTKSLILLMAGAAMLSSCDKHQGWSVEGTIDNAPDGAKVAIEGFNAGRWYNIDSVAVGTDGKFKYASETGAPYPDIYRVSLDGMSIYFPIDSLESITITADADNFDTDYNVSGWATAEEMMRIDKLISSTVSKVGSEAALNDSILKRELSIAINDDESGILGYYIINKTIGDKPIFSTTDRGDVRMIGALANKFNTKYPNDPRTAYLAQRYLQARSTLNPGSVGRVIEAQEAGLFDIELYDAKGQKQSLAELAKRSGITLLSFTAYDTEVSVPYNVDLNRVYELFRPQNLAIYQVSVDADEVQWRTRAANLPWTAVWYDNKDTGGLLRVYNVTQIPTTYVIDSNGDLVDRVDDHSELEAIIRKHL